MRQFRKGRRLVALCAQKSQTVQRSLIRLNSERNHLIAQITQCDNALRSFSQALISLQINAISVTRADIYQQRKKQAVLLFQRQQASVERSILQENLADLDLDIELNKKQLAILKRKEMKFSKWVQQDRALWLLQQDSANEDDVQEVFPWAIKSHSDRN